MCMPPFNPSDFRRLLHLTFVDSKENFLVVSFFLSFFFKGKKPGTAEDFFQNLNQGSYDFSA